MSSYRPSTSRRHSSLIVALLVLGLESALGVESTVANHQNTTAHINNETTMVVSSSLPPINSTADSTTDSTFVAMSVETIKLPTFNVRDASSDELHEYRQMLESTLASVRVALHERELQDDNEIANLIFASPINANTSESSVDHKAKRFISASSSSTTSPTTPTTSTVTSTTVTSSLSFYNTTNPTSGESDETDESGGGDGATSGTTSGDEKRARLAAALVGSVDSSPTVFGDQDEQAIPQPPPLPSSLTAAAAAAAAAAIEDDEDDDEPPSEEVARPPSPSPQARGVPTTRVVASRPRSFEPKHNHTLDECKRLTQAELVNELMAWNADGVFRLLHRSIVDRYDRQAGSPKAAGRQAVQRNVEALEHIIAELNMRCDVRAPDVLMRLDNLTLVRSEPRPNVSASSPRIRDEEVRRFKRHLLASPGPRERPITRSRRGDDAASGATRRSRLIGSVHAVPFGCDKRGELEDGYLRLCGACQAIRKLPETYFPPYINEVICDDESTSAETPPNLESSGDGSNKAACLYFYNYPHGKCMQNRLNLVVLRNVGTESCQVWQKVNLNVRVSCECFVDSMSFFSKYV